MDNSTVVVAGGGPAGSAAAMSLRRLGLSVILLDAATYPRDKVCGDVVLPAAQDSIRALGLDAVDVERLSFPCTGAVYTIPSGSQTLGDFRDQHGAAHPWWIVNRAVLDAWLLDAARRSGADVRQGWRVVAYDPARRHVVAQGPGGIREEFAPPVVVGADGAGSVIARHAGAARLPAQHVCLAARAYIEDPAPTPPRLEIFTTRQTLPGCAWILPVGPREANVGIGILQSDAQRLDMNPQRLFDEMLKQSAPLARRLRHVQVRRLSGWWLPGATGGRRLSGDGFILAGDAAAMSIHSQDTESTMHYRPESSPEK